MNDVTPFGLDAVSDAAAARCRSVKNRAVEEGSLSAEQRDDDR